MTVAEILKNHPEIQELYYLNQDKVGNSRNLNIPPSSTTNSGFGFLWADSNEGFYFWENILIGRRFEVRYGYKNYCKKSTNNTPLNNSLNYTKIKTFL